MHSTEIDTLPWMGLAKLQHWVTVMDREAAYEQERADAHAARAATGERGVGPESFAETARIKQRMADNRRQSAWLHRLAINIRFEVGDLS